MTAIEKANTHQLVAGNIVLAHGMRLLLGHRTERSTDCGAAGERLVVSFDGLVLNTEEVDAAHIVPKSWRNDPTHPAGEEHWTIQGNELANWVRESPSTTRNDR